MKVIIPASSFLLALAAFYLKQIQCSIDLQIAKLFTLDAVNEHLKSDMIALSHQFFYWIILIAVISAVIASVSLYHKLCNKIMGTILLLISVVSILFSLIRT